MTKSELPPELQRYADARARPSLFFFVDGEPIGRQHVLELHHVLGDCNFEELDLVVHSGGGSAHAAYQVMTLLRHHAETINVCVPFWAKSAATLLCIGGDRIVLGQHAELGPLDVQIYEEKKAGQGEYHSALDPFKALEQLQTFSVEALASAMKFIVRNYGMSYDDSLRHAVAFVEVTTGPLVGRLDPEKLGQYSRELSVATEYAQRMLRRRGGWDDDQIDRVVDQLVYGYPSHEYIIDLLELTDLGFDVEFFEPAEREAVQALLAPIADTREPLIKLATPAVEEAVESVELVSEARPDASSGSTAQNGHPTTPDAELEKSHEPPA